ncbi:methyltransferase domain-containing protein [Aeoliella mucimassa]|uniref:Methyltransferase domain-containing protein n=1 Tax=Aeoliella mucimassa TaxID=2527972 RepID=A0A518ALX3_9BACT|nr:methyltransferase domain-containing protein [Aeoliella mucimassa]QDU55706.1 hypothetical protein Pan181_19000 [Aeoliella mucimassa]
MEVSKRKLQPEWMDDPKLDRTLHVNALKGLQRINAWSRTSSVLWRAINTLAKARPEGKLRILDLACGGGDTVIRLARLAEHSNWHIEIDGCDVSSTAIDHATESASQAGVKGCRFYAHDVLEGPLPTGYDIVTSTLFLHHLEQSQAVDLLRRMAVATNHAVFVDDLLRTRTGYVLAQVGCRLLSRSPVVHFDGPVSVLGAYTLAEAQAIANEAGLHGARFQKHWPERYLLSWTKEK